MTQLTNEQLAVAWHKEGHAIVSAVPGSGKTESLLARLKYLLNTVPPRLIGVFMFNKDAAKSFRERFAVLSDIEPPQIRTFNSVGQRLMQRFQEKGLLPVTRLRNEAYVKRNLAKEVLTQVLRKGSAGDRGPDDTLVDGFVEFIGMVKSDVRSARAVFDEGTYSREARCFPEAFDAFELKRVIARVHFYDDQVRDPVLTMLREPDAVSLVTNRLEHVICDECQDMNPVQIELMRFLAGSRAQVMVVGDEDQSIYEWRGARPMFMLEGFEQKFGAATRYTLPHTFRFGHELALAANHLIVKNRERNDKFCLAHPTTPDTRVSLHVDKLGADLGRVLVTGALCDGAGLSDIAVLARYYAHSVSLQLDLLAAGIPFHVYGREPLIRIPELSALLGVLQLAAGNWAEALSQSDRMFAIRSVLQTPSVYMDGPKMDAVARSCMDTPENLTTTLRSLIDPNWSSYRIQTVRDRADLLQIVQDTDPNTTSAHDLLTLYLEGVDFDEAVRRQAVSAQVADETIRNVDAFMAQAASQGGTVTEFLEQMASLFDGQPEDPPSHPHVWVSSIHRAKGLGWKHVIVPGWTAGVLPPSQTDNPEEERRLVYVAMTRAKEHLHLLHAFDAGWHEAADSPVFDPDLRYVAGTASPYLWDIDLQVSRHCVRRLSSSGVGGIAPGVNRPECVNRYLREIGRADLATYTVAPIPPKPSAAGNAGSATSRLGIRGIPTPSTLPVGVEVRVEGFGRGKVVQWLQNRAVKIVFSNGDTKIADVGKVSIERV